MLLQWHSFLVRLLMNSVLVVCFETKWVLPRYFLVLQFGPLHVLSQIFTLPKSEVTQENTQITLAIEWHNKS